MGFFGFYMVQGRSPVAADHSQRAFDFDCVIQYGSFDFFYQCMSMDISLWIFAGGYAYKEGI